MANKWESGEATISHRLFRETLINYNLNWQGERSEEKSDVDI